MAKHLMIEIMDRTLQPCFQPSGRKESLMTNLNISNIINACDTLARRITTIGGEFHGSSWIFNQCMRAFDNALPAQAITFSVFINSPVMKAGEATINRDGRLEMRVV